MMDWTTPACRFLLRLITRHSWLYTEMVTTGAVLNNPQLAALNFSPSEHPVAVQLGGSDPIHLSAASAYCERLGFDAINLNLGCPSERVQSGRFGACLMTEPTLVADCITAMREAVSIPVTAKTRLGVDDRDSYAQLLDFVATIAQTGCDTVIVHARKAWLKGLSPKQNREVPPLEYHKVHRLKRDLPELTIIINGGFTDCADIKAQLEHVDGVMIGREAYQNPYFLHATDAEFFATRAPSNSRAEIVHRYFDYACRAFESGVRLGQLTQPLLGLFHAQPGARRWRRHLSEHAHQPDANPEIILQALEIATSEKLQEREC